MNLSKYRTTSTSLGLPFLQMKRKCQNFSMSAWRNLHPETIINVVTDHQIAKYANQPLGEFKLADLVKYGRTPISVNALLSSANSSLSLLSIRLAYRIKALWHLPFIVVANPNIKKLYTNYLNSLSTLLSHDFKHITKIDEETLFTKVLIALVESHSQTISTLARGFTECRKYMSPDEVAKFLNEHLHARIGTRLIAEQHIAIHNSFHQQQELNSDANGQISSPLIGILDTSLKPANMVNSCGSFVSEICESRYNVRPSWVIDGDSSTTIAYIPVHLQYILTELLKNAFRATIENGMHQEPIIITISSVPITTKSSCQLASSINELDLNLHEYLDQRVTIRIRDRGGGISPETLPHIWSYSFTTFSEDNFQQNRTDFMNEFNINLDAGIGPNSIAGLGYGLPLARTYAEYFGGSISVQSLYGWGCDVYLRLNGLGRIKQ
ncbi:kinase, mitochondrial [Erysiphe neolycopersici]|uniref:Protein-serine/threonine kinase n=1 Tax=Erysiphe neolycopersici TaxID=212602 RepID=A0A420HQI7_9PEZI|nr:kinase, mitochondrial [Erysiphe neolycopersici]